MVVMAQQALHILNNLLISGKIKPVLFGRVLKLLVILLLDRILEPLNLVSNLEHYF